jgi:hypothetical protein
MATTKKALVMAEELVSELRQRQTALAVALTYDTDGSPLVRLGSGVASSTGTPVAGALFKIMPISWPLAKDILGLDATMFHPHVVKVNVEANYASTVDTVADNNTPAQMLLYIAAAVTRGARVEMYVSTFGTAPNATDLADATKLTGVWEPNQQYPMLSSQ